MKRFFFIISAIFLTTNADALTITCQNIGDISCTIDESLYAPKSCNEIKKTDLDNDNYLYLTRKLFDNCSNQIRSFFKNSKCPAIQRFYLTNNELIAYCITNTTIKQIYINEETDTWSYAHKRCIGSKGKWNTDTQTCNCDDLEGTKEVNNECLCEKNKEKQKYYNMLLSGCETLADGVYYAGTKTKIYGFYKDLSESDRLNSCGVTGGNWNDKNNECICDSDTLNMEPNSTKYFCNCKDGYDYRNPLEKSDGCILKNEIDEYTQSETPKKTEPENKATDTNTGATDATGTVNTDINDATGGDAYESQNENEKSDISDKLKSAQDALTAAQDKENSLANRLLGQPRQRVLVQCRPHPQSQNKTQTRTQNNKCVHISLP